MGDWGGFQREGLNTCSHIHSPIMELGWKAFCVGTLGRQLGQGRFIPEKDLLLTDESDLCDPCAWARVLAETGVMAVSTCLNLRGCISLTNPDDHNFYVQSNLCLTDVRKSRVDPLWPAITGTFGTRCASGPEGLCKVPHVRTRRARPATWLQVQRLPEQ